MVRPTTLTILIPLLFGYTWTDAQEHQHAPGDPAHVDRTVPVEAYDTMRFSVDDLYVRPGETIRFVVTNKGRLQHEFSIGTVAEQRMHAAMMRENPTMEHTEPNAILLRPGETKELIWQFGGEESLEIGCMVPGHYEAGMIVPLKWTR